MHLLVAFVAATWTASMLYRLVPVPASVDRARMSRVMATEAPPTLPFWRVLLIPFNALAAKLPASMALNVERLLYWTQFQGAWVGWTAVEFWGLRLAVVMLALAIGMVVYGKITLTAALAVGSWMYLGSRLSSPAEKAIRQLEQELPEVAGQVAMLVGTGKPVVEALRIVAVGRGVVARWIQRVLASCPADRPLLGGRGRPGFLREEAERARVPSLINFAVQLDILGQAGVGEQILLRSLAESIAAEYQAQIQARAEALPDKLTVPVAVFYLVPYLAGLLVPVLLGNLFAMR